MSEESKVKIKLINLRDEPFRHPEYADRDEKGVWLTDEENRLKHKKEFNNGDVVELSRPAADHLIATGQGEEVKNG